MKSFKKLVEKQNFSFFALFIFCLVFILGGIYIIYRSFAATDIYVAKTGSDLNGDGSQLRPFQSIQKAVSQVVPGQNIYVLEGTYSERVTVPATASGTSTTHTKIVAQGPVVVSQGFVLNSNYTDLSGFEITPGIEGKNDTVGQIHIQGDYNKIDNVNVHDTVSGSAVVFGAGASYNQLSKYKISTVAGYGLHFYRGYHTDPQTGATFNEARDGVISHHKGSAAVYLDGKKNLLDGITIQGGPSGTDVGDLDGDGIRVNGPDMTIRNFTIRDLWEWYNSRQHTDCIQFYTGDVGNLLIENGTIGTWKKSGGYDTTKGPGQPIMAENNGTGYLRIPTVVTVNNVVFMGQPTGINADGVSVAINFNASSPLYVDFYINNSTFWGQRMDTAAGGRKRIHAYNNIFTKSNNFSYDDGLRFYEGNYNLHVENPVYGNVPAPKFREGINSIITTDPLFVNPDNTATTNYGESADLSLKSSSRAINAGDPNRATPTDFTGRARVGLPDMGAFEYIPESTTVPPVPEVSDTTNPTVSIVSPTNNSVVKGATEISVRSTDNINVDKVVLYLDGKTIFTFYPNATASLDRYLLSNLKKGTHVLKATAFDKSGNNSSNQINIRK